MPVQAIDVELESAPVHTAPFAARVAQRPEPEPIEVSAFDEDVPDELIESELPEEPSES